MPNANDVARGVADEGYPEVPFLVGRGDESGTAVAAAFARQLAESAQRAAGLKLAALEAARIDTDIAAVAAQLVNQRQVMAAWLVDGLRQRSPLRNGVDRDSAIAAVWALMDPGLFCRLTSDQHWSAARFRDWFADAVVRLLLPVNDQQATSTP